MSLHLPASVRTQLDKFERRLRIIETTLAILGAVGGLLAAFLILFVSDRFWDTPVVVRALLALAGTIGVGAAAWYWAQRWVVRRRDERQFAVMVQREFPRLGDRLLGIVELADESKRPENISAELCRAALEQVAAESSSLDFQQAVPMHPAKRAALIVAIAGVVAVAGMLALPAAGWNAMQRWLRPWASVPRYTLVELSGIAPKIVVPYGESFEVAGKVGGQWRPDVARGRFDGQSGLEAPVTSGSFTFRVPGQTRAGEFAVRVGDARARTEVQPMYRPELTTLSAKIEFPDYLSYGAATQDVRNGTLEIVEGAHFSLIGQVSRELSGAWWNTNETLTVSGKRFESAVLPAETITVEWRDTFGLRAKTPVTLAVKAKPDQAPIVDLQKQPPVVAILEDEVLPVDVEATDDFGVKQIGLSWEGEALTTGTAVVAEGGQQRRQVSGKYRFAPQTLGVAPQLVTLRATAVDYFPGREPVQSRGYRVLILDYASHAQLVQREFEKLQEVLEEITRAEELANDTNRQLADQPPEKRTPEKRAMQEQMERENAEKLRKLQEQLAKLMKEALRNRTIPESVLKDWAKLWENIQPLPAEWMPDVAESLKHGQMPKALAKQGEVLKRLADLLKQLQDANESMQAANFVQRLRQASETEHKISDTMRALLPVVAGARIEDLPAETRVKVRTTHAQQEGTQRQVKYIRDDLGAFARRARQSKYREVHEEMEETRVVDELDKLAGLIGENRGAQSIGASARWAEQLELWADKLGKRPGSGSGEGEGDEPSREKMELLMKLMRLRQAEQGIRETTHSLEEHKKTLPTYDEMSCGLGDKQRRLMDNVDAIAKRFQDDDVLALLNQVGNGMEEAAGALGVPNTGEPAIGPETEVIELLSQACNNASSGSGMAGLMRRMGLGTGTKGGGSLAGGDTDKASSEAAGSKTGAAAAEHTVEKASGAGQAALPEEFRDALESYFEQREKLP